MSDRADHPNIEGRTIKSMRDAFNMTKQRCYNKACKDYKHYGGRDIKICDRWLESFDNFLTDMGVRPKGMTLERVDNDGDYCPDNCIWATRAAQGQNTRQSRLITYKGGTHTVAEWERLLGFKRKTLRARINTLGYSIEEAMTKSVKSGGMVPGKKYKHLEDQSWRNTQAMHLKPKTPKLSIEDVTNMRLLYKEVAMTFTMVGRLFGVSTETASSAIQGIAAYGGY